jgi:polyhydroxyalkanoate synthase
VTAEATKNMDDGLALPDLEALTANTAKLMEEMGRATAASLKPIEEGRGKVPDEVSDVVKTFGVIAEHWANEPQKMVLAQTNLTKGFLDLWAGTLRKANGEGAEPVAAPEPTDKRFKDPEWSTNPVFDFIKQAYLLTTRWAEDVVEHTDGIDDHTRHKAQFYLRQLSGALAPTNFVATNPELIRETLKQNGENLVRGMKMLAEDIEAGKGQLKLRQSDGSSFKVGVNLATTPGKVVFRNDLFELIQYTPTTETVFKRPLLIVPPWINKFYILDLNPEKSFIKWAVEQGLTVFCISWVNPDQRQAEKTFEDYMREGVLTALDAIEDCTGEKDVTAIGYCVGGTLLSVTLAYMAAVGDTRISSATFFTTQVDFTYAGDLKVFVDEEQIRLVEDRMYAQGYLEGSSMASAFNMLRPNDLIWPYVVNVYLKGQSPFPFDLLFWNSDSTRMPAANHSFYLRNCYLENKLTKGEMEIGGIMLDLGKVKIPVYNLAAREDHIAPAKSVFLGSQYFGGPVEFVLAGSGHIAGVVNPASKPKYQYWTGEPPRGELDHWTRRASEHPGTWWPHWAKWIEAQAPEKVKARKPGGRRKTLGDAPGTYVLTKA